MRTITVQDLIDSGIVTKSAILSFGMTPESEVDHDVINTLETNGFVNIDRMISGLIVARTAVEYDADPTHVKDFWNFMKDTRHLASYDFAVSAGVQDTPFRNLRAFFDSRFRELKPGDTLHTNQNIHTFFKTYATPLIPVTQSAPVPDEEVLPDPDEIKYRMDDEDINEYIARNRHPLYFLGVSRFRGTRNLPLYKDEDLEGLNDSIVTEIKKAAADYKKQIAEKKPKAGLKLVESAAKLKTEHDFPVVFTAIDDREVEKYLSNVYEELGVSRKSKEAAEIKGVFKKAVKNSIDNEYESRDSDPSELRYLYIEEDVPYNKYLFESAKENVIDELRQIAGKSTSQPDGQSGKAGTPPEGTPSAGKKGRGTARKIIENWQTMKSEDEADKLIKSAKKKDSLGAGMPSVNLQPKKQNRSGLFDYVRGMFGKKQKEQKKERNVFKDTKLEFLGKKVPNWAGYAAICAAAISVVGATYFAARTLDYNRDMGVNQKIIESNKNAADRTRSASLKKHKKAAEKLAKPAPLSCEDAIQKYRGVQGHSTGGLINLMNSELCSQKGYVQNDAHLDSGDTLTLISMLRDDMDDSGFAHLKYLVEATFKLNEDAIKNSGYGDGWTWARHLKPGDTFKRFNTSALRDFPEVSARYYDAGGSDGKGYHGHNGAHKPVRQNDKQKTSPTRQTKQKAEKKSSRKSGSYEVTVAGKRVGVWEGPLAEIIYYACPDSTTAPYKRGSVSGPTPECVDHGMDIYKKCSKPAKNEKRVIDDSCVKKKMDDYREEKKKAPVPTPETKPIPISSPTSATSTQQVPSATATEIIYKSFSEKGAVHFGFPNSSPLGQMISALNSAKTSNVSDVRKKSVDIFSYTKDQLAQQYNPTISRSNRTVTKGEIRSSMVQTAGTINYIADEIAFNCNDEGCADSYLDAIRTASGNYTKGGGSNYQMLNDIKGRGCFDQRDVIRCVTAQRPKK